MSKILKTIIKQSKEVIAQSKVDIDRLQGHINKINIDIMTAEAIIIGVKEL